MKSKSVLIISLVIILIFIIGIYMFSLFKPKLDPELQILEQKGIPISSLIDKMSDDVFPNQKFFLIDNSLIFVERSGFASDYSFHHVLLDKNQKELCSFADNFAGPQLQCEDTSKKEIFEIITKNLNKENLGLTDHKVELIYSKIDLKK